MVQKKRLSKRMSLKDKYKVIRKVNEHHRKQRKEAKKNPQKKSKKDIGIPNLWPFKEQMLAQMEARRLKLEEENAQAKAERIRKRAKARERAAIGLPTMEALARQAILQGKAYEAQERAGSSVVSSGGDEAITSWKGNRIRDKSRKAFFQDFLKVVETADVILEILDARDPLGCRCLHAEAIIQQKDPNKRIILVLNKIDLVPRSVVKAWLAYLRNFYPTIAFKASTQSQKTHLTQGASGPNNNVRTEGGSECLGADRLLSLLKNYCQNNGIKTSITVGLIGYPNVGKSSIINSLKRTRACNVGSLAGITRNIQKVILDKNIKLIDSPGIVFASSSIDADVILRNCVNVHSIEDPIEPVGVILRRCDKNNLMELYNIPEYYDTMDFLAKIAVSKSMVVQGGTPNYDKAARNVLQAWISGDIPFYTVPPALGAGVHVAAEIKSEWSEAFDENNQEERDMMMALQSGEGRPHVAMKHGNMDAAIDYGSDVEIDEDDEDEGEGDMDDEDLGDDGEDDRDVESMSDVDDPDDEEGASSGASLASTASKGYGLDMTKGKGKAAALVSARRTEEDVDRLNPTEVPGRGRAEKMRRKAKRRAQKETMRAEGGSRDRDGNENMGGNDDDDDDDSASDFDFKSFAPSIRKRERDVADMDM